MTTSIVFGVICENVETDLSGERNALRRLRFLKTRETGDEIIQPNTDGRDRRSEIDFDSITYEQYQMRRKMEVLKYKKNVKVNTKTNYANISRRGSSRYKSLSNARIKALRDAQTCENSSIIVIKKSTNSGIYGGNDNLYLDNNVEFIDKL